MPGRFRNEWRRAIGGAPDASGRENQRASNGGFVRWKDEPELVDLKSQDSEKGCCVPGTTAPPRPQGGDVSGAHTKTAQARTASRQKPRQIPEK
jgi:hypothetical protein